MDILEDVSSRRRPAGGSCSLYTQHHGKKLLNKHFFLIAVVVAIGLALAGPQIGKTGGPLYAQYTISFGATMSIFLLSGLSLKTSELVKAFKNIKLNCYIQFFSFFIIPAMTYPIVTLLNGSFISSALLDGLLITACLPCTVNMCTTLTTAAHGDISAAVFNASVGNFLGIFITPLLLLGFMNVHADVPFSQVILKLLIKVVAPMTVGQFLRYLPGKEIGALMKKHDFTVRRSQEVLLATLVYKVGN